MQDLIERRAALTALCEDCLRKYDGICPHPASRCVEFRTIMQLPAIEAEPVRRMTNAERIRNMTDAELAYFLKTTSCSICCDHPLNCGFECASLYTIKAEKTEQEVRSDD